jgi:hypothetical protein
MINAIYNFFRLILFLILLPFELSGRFNRWITTGWETGDRMSVQFGVAVVIFTIIHILLFTDLSQVSWLSVAHIMAGA